MEAAALVVSVFALFISAWSAVYTRSQARSAREQVEQQRKSHNLEREAALRIRMSHRFELGPELRDSGSNVDSIWFIENNGRSPALSVRVDLEFDPNHSFGFFSFARIEAGQVIMLEPRKPLPDLAALYLPAEGRFATATIEWQAIDGTERSITETPTSG